MIFTINGIFYSISTIEIIMVNIIQSVSYSKKFRVKRGFPNYLVVAISEFPNLGQPKNSYIIDIQLFFPDFS